MQCFRSEKSESIPPYFVQVCHKCDNLKKVVMLYPLFHAPTSSSVDPLVWSIPSAMKSAGSVCSNNFWFHSAIRNCTDILHQIVLKKKKKKGWGSAPDPAPTYVCISRTTFSFVPTALHATHQRTESQRSLSNGSRARAAATLLKSNTSDCAFSASLHRGPSPQPTYLWSLMEVVANQAANNSGTNTNTLIPATICICMLRTYMDVYYIKETNDFGLQLLTSGSRC